MKKYFDVWGCVGVCVCVCGGGGVCVCVCVCVWLTEIVCRVWVSGCGGGCVNV